MSRRSLAGVLMLAALVAAACDSTSPTAPQSIRVFGSTTTAAPPTDRPPAQPVPTSPAPNPPAM